MVLILCTLFLYETMKLTVSPDTCFPWEGTGLQALAGPGARL